jgi:hypothetical protein
MLIGSFPQKLAQILSMPTHHMEKVDNGLRMRVPRFCMVYFWSMEFGLDMVE